MSYEPVIGLEVHVELLTQSKMFCGCAVVDSTHTPPNASVCEICTGMPGTLPVVNERAVEFALRAALALNCTVTHTSLFARKNYFYPDLPKGYQISQYELPLAHDGWLTVEGEAGEKAIRIRRVHLEEDTGKLFHRDGYSLVDYNRSGVPLLEVVTEPDLTSLEEVKACANALRSLFRYLGISSGDMEKGAMRFEANVSLRLAGSQTLGTRTEIKNLNSIRAMLRALAFEIERQGHLLTQGGVVIQETVGWDDVRETTFTQRNKEEADDYRYFPEPDIPPLAIDSAWIEKIRSSLPELPAAKRARYVADYGLTPYAATVLTSERNVAEYFEAAVAARPKVPAPKMAHWVTGELFGLLNQAGKEIDAAGVAPGALAELVEIVELGQINLASGKAVLAEVFEKGGSPRSVVEARGLAQWSSQAQIEQLVRQVLAASPEQVQQYLAGKQPIFEWLLGQAMRAAGGRANPTVLRQALESALAHQRDRHRRD
ncbi:MAG TPA: Asp-tRNA(Asn)/Glu-tRNA(Gln) amidotransferase subunit GatB [Anaerolineales bacterium]|nr:Asp-tRNA(Asn)/Glu-tRNA(Gln) amidotransferase subunit GatB [Anaerolineales bacterium]